MENIKANHLPQWMVKLFDDTGEEREFQNWDNEVTESTRPLIKWLATTDFNNLPEFSGKSLVKMMKDENLTKMTEGRVRASLNILKDSYFGVPEERSGGIQRRPKLQAIHSLNSLELRRLLRQLRQRWSTSRKATTSAISPMGDLLSTWRVSGSFTS